MLYPYPGDYYDDNDANCDTIYQGNEIGPWSDGIENMEEGSYEDSENAKNMGDTDNRVSKKQTYIYK